MAARQRVKASKKKRHGRQGLCVKKLRLRPTLETYAKKPEKQINRRAVGGPIAFSAEDTSRKRSGQANSLVTACALTSSRGWLRWL